MKNASILLGLVASFLMNAQDVVSQTIDGGASTLSVDCEYEIPPCEEPLLPPKDDPFPSPSLPAPPPAPGGGGIHNLPGAPVFKETIIIPGNNMLKDFKLDEPKMLDMQKQLQNR
ncbi:hypothetical protein ACQZ5D_18525 [Agrobacterium sp. 22-211-1]|uniref:hypothetical protein n=1 Tax=Rhizobium/Agrobacterium group TaxID=227290 RepID=UPI001CDA0A3B|nr:hypothetical protein [Rhizobium rhizogenes]MCA2379175.1 hypothetical protein [Agrobacterium tomkonis RTP8]MCZ7455402.1 hypothetical protein [Rhizobium rhizogenes]